MKALTPPRSDIVLRICPNCKTLEEDDNLTTCHAHPSKNVPGSICGGPLRPVKCLKCRDQGTVEINDPRDKKPEVRPCPNGCGGRGHD